MSWYLAQENIASNKLVVIWSVKAIQLNKCARTWSVAMQTSLVPVAKPSTSNTARVGGIVWPLVGEGGGVAVPDLFLNFVVSCKSTVSKIKK